MGEKIKYAAFLRGINVGGHHKVPMAELRKVLEEMGFSGVKTLLNSGNVIFEGSNDSIPDLEKKIAQKLEGNFGFPVPVLIRKGADIKQFIASGPFDDILLTPDIRRYVTFIREDPQKLPDLPWIAPDDSYRITEIRDKMIISVLDVSITKSPDAMDALEKFVSKDVTTRNWNTILKIGQLL